MRGWAAAFLSQPWPALTFAVLALVAVVVFRPLADRLGWPRLATLGTLLAAAVIATLTFPPAPGASFGGLAPGELPSCLDALFSPRGLWYGLTATEDRGERIGNVLMFVPLTFFATLASRRPVVVALAGMALPVLVELTQAFLNVGRDCVGYDWVNNAIGALLGAVGGAVFMWLAHTAGRRE